MRERWERVGGGEGRREGERAGEREREGERELEERGREREEGAEDLPGTCSQVIRTDPSSDVQVGVVHLVHVVTHSQLKDVHRALRHAVGACAQAGHRLRVAVAHACKQFVG